MIFIDEERYKKEIGIYKITNIVNGLVYIGQTTQGFQKRYWMHQWHLRKGKHDNQHLQNAWNLYGENNFQFSVVEILPKEKIDEREVYWIKFYRVLGKCYSIQDGGQPKRLVDFVSKESRRLVGEKNRQRLLGSHLSEETKEKMSLSRKGKFVQKKTLKITPEQARAIKEKLISGFTPKEIMEELNIDYKPINGIISSNTWAHVKVAGWDEFQKNRKRGKGMASVNRKSKPSVEKISTEELKNYYMKYKEIGSLSKTAAFFNTTISKARTRIKKYEQTLCQSCAKPLKEEEG